MVSFFEFFSYSNLFLVFFIYFLFCFVLSFSFSEYLHFFDIFILKNKNIFFVIFLYITLYSLLWYNKDLLFFYFLYFSIFILLNFFFSLFFIFNVKLLTNKFIYLRKEKKIYSFLFFLFFILAVTCFTRLLFILIKKLIWIFFDFLEEAKLVCLIVLYNIIHNPFYFSIFYYFCCYLCSLNAYSSDLLISGDFYMKKNFEKCLDGAEKLDYYAHLGKKKPFSEASDDVVANFIVRTANDPIAARLSLTHAEEYEQISKHLGFSKIYNISYAEFISSVRASFIASFSDPTRPLDFKGFIYFLSDKIENGPDGITPKDAPEQYKVVQKLHANHITDVSEKYKKVIDEHDMTVHIFYKSFHNKADFEIFKREHPEFFKNIILHDMTQQFKVTEEQAKKMLNIIKFNSDYFEQRAKVLSKNSWFFELIRKGIKK